MDWNSSALWGMIGLIGGIIVSFIFYKKGNKKKQIIYIKNSQILISNTLSNIDGLSITYQESPIKNLISTTINIKSIGKGIVDFKDFGKATPFCIKTTEQFFIPKDINEIIVKNSNPNNLFELIIINDKTININFDYFSYKDEISLSILHTGTIDVEGKIKDGDLLNQSHNDRHKITDFFTICNLSMVLIFIYVIGQVLFFNGLDLINNLINFCSFFGLGLFFMDYLKDILNDIISNLKTPK